VASEPDAALGLAVGDVVVVEPGGLELEVVGRARDVNLFASPTAFGTYATFEDVVAASNPDARAPLPNALALAPAEGVTDDELVEAVNATSPEVDALTRADAATESPGVADVNRSFQIILGLFGLVVPIVTGLFFLIVTFQKAESLTLLRAVGIAGRRLVASLLVQVAVIMGAALALGTLLYLPLSQQRIGEIPLRFQGGAVLVWWVVLSTLGLLSSLLAAKRVLRIDPIEATTGAEVR
jgi:putative ABC transport system permease protein